MKIAVIGGGSTYTPELVDGMARLARTVGASRAKELVYSGRFFGAEEALELGLREKPDVVFAAGDLYDGTALDTVRAAEPLRDLRAPQGAYFVAGNHEQFGDDSKYLRAVAGAGVRVLENEKVEADGLQIVGEVLESYETPRRVQARHRDLDGLRAVRGALLEVEPP